MNIRHHGILYERLQPEHLAEVRKWRNTEKIRKFMRFRDHITEEMHLKWFDSVDNEYNYYFIMRPEDANIGMISMKRINFEEGTGEIGAFVWDDRYLNTFVSGLSLLMIMEFTFYVLGLKEVQAPILAHNERVISNFKGLGGYFVDPPDEHMVLMIANLETYEPRAVKLRRAGKVMTEIPSELHLELEKNTPISAFVQHRIDHHAYYGKGRLNLKWIES